MQVAYSPPTLLPSTAPLRLTPKAPHPLPTQFSSRPGYFLPASNIPTPSSSLRRSASNPCRAPTVPLHKRVRSTSVLQQTGAFPCEGSRTVVATEGPIMAPRTRQRHVGGELTGSLGGVPSVPKRRATSAAESSTRVDISTSSHSFSQSKSSSSIQKPSMKHSRPTPGPGTSISPTTPKRRWPFSSGSFWPHMSATNPNASGSPRSSFDSDSSTEAIAIIAGKQSAVPRRGILKKGDRSSWSSSRSRVSFGPDPQSVTSVALPARESVFSDIANDEEHGVAGQDRTMSELFEVLFLLSSGGKRSSYASFLTINEHLDVPQIAVEQGEEDVDIAKVARETYGVDQGLQGSSQINVHRFSGSVPLSFTNSYPWKPEDTQATRPLHTKRSSCALPQVIREANGGGSVALVTQTPSPPPSPIKRNVFPIEEELDANILNDIQDIRISEDGKLDVSALSDDQWTLRAESINDGALDQKSNVDLPRHSALLSLPRKARLQEREPPLIAAKKPEPETSLIDRNFTLDLNHSDSSYPAPSPTTRSSSLALPTARRLRRIPRTDLLDERASQQWDREKINDDVRKVTQRPQSDKVQKAWQLVGESADAPMPRAQTTNTPQDPVPRNPFSPSLPTGISRAAMLPPGMMEWATVDSASPDTTGALGPVFRLCIAWRLTSKYNAINHPFGAQEEVKVFVLGRTHEEFYQFYEGLMSRFMLEPRRHKWAKWEEVGPKSRASLDPMERPADDEKLDFASNGDDRTQEIMKRKVATLDAWTQGLMRLRGTKMGFVLESDYVRMWMAPWREGDCECVADNWRKDGHGEIGRSSESIARVLEILW